MIAHLVHMETVSPGLAPGAIWVRICSEHDLIVEESIPAIEMVGRLAAKHADLVKAYAARGETVWTFFYDGDSGERMGTLIGYSSKP